MNWFNRKVEYNETEYKTAAAFVGMRSINRHTLIECTPVNGGTAMRIELLNLVLLEPEIGDLAIIDTGDGHVYQDLLVGTSANGVTKYFTTAQTDKSILSEHITPINPMNNKLFPIEPQTPIKEAIAIGVEYEASNRKVINLGNSPIGSQIYDEHNETSCIREANLEPINLKDFNRFLDTFMTISDIDKFEYSKGTNTPNSSSMHTHISYKGNPKTAILNQNWAIALAPALFSKVSHSYKFRELAAIPYNDSNRATFCDMSKDPYRYQNNKSKFVTVNRVNNNLQTIEYRINENTLPLWTYLVPVLSSVDDLFKKEANTIVTAVENITYGTGIEDFYTNKLKSLTKKSIRKAKRLRIEVLEHWKPIVNDYDTFKKIMNFYFKTDFDNVKTYNFIKGR